MLNLRWEGERRRDSATPRTAATSPRARRGRETPKAGLRDAHRTSSWHRPEAGRVTRGGGERAWLEITDRESGATLVTQSWDTGRDVQDRGSELGGGARPRPRARAVSVAAGVRGPMQGAAGRREDPKFSGEGSARQGGGAAPWDRRTGPRGRFLCLFLFVFLMIREIGARLRVDGEDELIGRKEHPGSDVPEQVRGAGCHTQARGRHG